jgi:imidazolonepropionase-like amidohydrolase
VVALVAALTLASAAAADPHHPHPHGHHHGDVLVPEPFGADPYPSTYQPLPRVDTLVAHATVLDGAGHRLDDADVLMRDGKVAAVGRGLSPPPGAVVIDAKGRWVTPGLIDDHSHDGDWPAPVTSQMLEHSPVNEASDWNTADVWAEHSVLAQDPSFARALAGGVTTLLVLPGSGNLFGGRSVTLKPVPAVTVQAMKFPGAPYSLKMACGENPDDEHAAGRFPTSPMGNFAGYRQAWAKAQAYMRRWDAYERGEEDEPPPRDLKLDTLAGVLRGEIRVQMHCYRAEEMAAVLDLAREFGYRVTAFHHAVEAYKIAPLLAKDDVCAVVWSDWWGYKAEALDGLRENAAFVDAAGACVTLHSDIPVLGSRLAVEAGKAMAAGRRAGLDIRPEHAITWITRNPAKVLGLQDRIGTLEPGKNADLVVWSGDPFSVYSKADEVFVDGALAFDRLDPKRQPVLDVELGQPARETAQ